MNQADRFTRRDFIKSTALTAAATLVTPAFAQTSPDARSRSERILNGWEYYRGGLGGIWEVWGGEKGSDHIQWQSVQLPHCFNASDAVDPDQPYYQGPGWYRIRLKPVNPFPQGRTLLHFEGTGQTSEVYAGAKRVGEHVGGYDEFVIDISDSLSALGSGADLPLAVRCDNSRDLSRIPSLLSDFNLYGGLYRYVNLVYVPAVSLQRVHVQATVEEGKAAKVSVKARLYNPGALRDKLELVIRILGPTGKVIHNSSQELASWEGDRELSTITVQTPELWSPAKPALYRCEITLDSAHGQVTVAERFGFRYFEFVEHGPFNLNGERLLLKGTQRHEDHAGLGAAMPEDLIRKEMQLIKEMGANFIRLGHYQQSRIVLDLCDELGLLVWEEIPWCRGGVGDEAYKRQVRNSLRAMIDEHYNHASVMIWGLGNENDWPGEFPELNQEAIADFMKELNAEAHRLDPSRKTAIRRCDFAKDAVDVYAPTLWAGWYRGQYVDYKSMCQKEMEKVKHFLHIEWGADSHAGRHSEITDKMFLAENAATKSASEPALDFVPAKVPGNPSREGDWSETYACTLFDWHLKEQETMPWLTGSAQWAFKDFSTPVRADNPIPRMNQKGLVERDLTPKECYYVFQSYWSGKPMARICGHSWPVRWGEPEELKLIRVYSNCDTAELFVNGVSCGAKKRDSQDFPAAGLRWAVKLAAGENHVRVVARKNAMTVDDKIRCFYQTEKWEKPARLRLTEKSRLGDRVTIEAALLDAKGVLCLDARNQIRFGLTGSGKLLANFGTCSGSRVVELRNGRAEITILLSDGASVASVSSKGIAPTFLSLR